MTIEAEKSLLEKRPDGAVRRRRVARRVGRPDLRRGRPGDGLARSRRWRTATPTDAAAALDAAVAAAGPWARTPPRERSDILRRTFDAVRARADELALLMTLEMGKPLAEARGEVTYGNEFLRWFSEEAVRISGRFGPNPEGTGRMIVSRHPVGPCHLITPWNFPLAMATRKIGPALAAGCTAVVKPAELTPLTTLLLTSILVEAGLPAGVVNVVTTTDPGAVSGTIIADPRLRKLSFTGSTAVGQRLLGQAAQGVLRTSMELGGNAPFLVFADADVDAAVDGAMLAKFRNVGEACTAANRFIVAAEVADEFVSKVSARVAAMRVGRGTEEGVQIGPLINQAARDKAEALVGDAVERGAEVVVGGTLDRRARHLLRADRRHRGAPGAAASSARRSSGRSSPSRPSTARRTASASRTTPSTGSSRTPTPATSPAACG